MNVKFTANFSKNEIKYFEECFEERKDNSEQTIHFSEFVEVARNFFKNFNTSEIIENRKKFFKTKNPSFTESEVYMSKK